MFNTRTRIKTKPREIWEDRKEVTLVGLLDQVKSKQGETEEVLLDRIVDLCQVIEDPDFVAKAALYARQTMHLTTAPTLMAGELAFRLTGSPNPFWKRRFFVKMCGSPEDTTELLAYYIGKYGTPIPNAMKRGIRDAIQEFGSKELERGSVSDKPVSLLQAAEMTHVTGSHKLEMLKSGLKRGRLREQEAVYVEPTDDLNQMVKEIKRVEV